MIPTTNTQAAAMQPFTRLAIYGPSSLSVNEALQLLQSRKAAIDPYRAALCKVVAESAAAFLKPRITTSRDAAAYFQDIADLNLEVFKCMLLDRSNNVLEVIQVSQGGTSGTVVDPRVIFRAALTCTKGVASSVVLCHNHPSGNLKPSQQDLEITRKLKAGGAHLDIQIADHIIIGSGGYFSFAEEGLLSNI